MIIRPRETMVRVRRNKKGKIVSGIYEPLESDLSVSFYTKYLILKAYNQLDNIFVIHIPNERKTSVAYGMRLKRMGVVSGVADYLVSIRGGRHAFIEMKRTSKAKQSPTQIKFEEEMCALGIDYYLVWDVEIGINLLLKLNGR